MLYKPSTTAVIFEVLSHTSSGILRHAKNINTKNGSKKIGYRYTSFNMANSFASSILVFDNTNKLDAVSGPFKTSQWQMVRTPSMAHTTSNTLNIHLYPVS